MEALFTLLFFVGFIALVVKFFSKLAEKGANDFRNRPVVPRPRNTLVAKEKVLPFKKKKYLMTQTEYKFFDVLKKIIGDKYLVIPQVALSRIIEVGNTPERYGPDSWYSNFSRINKKSVDYVIFDKQYFSPLLVIELDDYTHTYYKRQQRDNFLDAALKSAGLNILHAKPQFNYDARQLEQTIFSYINA